MPPATFSTCRSKRRSSRTWSIEASALAAGPTPITAQPARKDAEAKASAEPPACCDEWLAEFPRSAVVKVAQRVEVTVLEVDLERKRISLSMKKGATGDRKAPPVQASQDRGPRTERRQEKPRQDKQKQQQKKPEPAPFNNPFARAFGKDKQK